MDNAVTVEILPLPAMNHPIWSLGFAAVTVAYAVCSAFFCLRGDK